MPPTRRTLLKGAAIGALLPAVSWATRIERRNRLILAPSNLGLRPLTPGHEPGAWRAPAALMSAGLAKRLGVTDIDELPRPPYSFKAQAGTRVRNGRRLREHGLALSRLVSAALERGERPIVIGGDCSVLLGSLHGARHAGRCGLVHIDGHNDFFHPGNYDASRALGTAAGMDLALATGRGEALLTHWPDAGDRLVDDDDAIQIGDREPEGDDDWIEGAIARIVAPRALKLGVEGILKTVNAHFARRALTRVWVHVDLDVLDEAVMPAVDSPGSPGFDYDFLAALLRGLLAQERVLGLDVTIFDPELDPEGRYARGIVDCLARAFGRDTAAVSEAH